VSRRQDMRLPAIVVTVVLLGVSGYAINRSNDAQQPVTESVTIDDAESRLVHQRFQQSVAMLHARQFEYAVQSLHVVLALRPAMPEAHANMGFALLGLDRHAAARDFFETATNLRPSQNNAYYGLAIANESLGDLRSAVAAMRTFVHRVPHDDPYRVKAEAAIWEWQSELSGAER